MQAVSFRSGEIWLEGMLSVPTKAPASLRAVIAHPHPQFGGSMDNNVVCALFAALVDFGALVLRFNFRGVGASEGRYGNLHGEAEDIIAAAEFLESVKVSSVNGLLLAGYSFGGLAALYALARGLKPQALVLVSPMIPEGGFSACAEFKKIIPLQIPAMILSGERDEFFNHELCEPLLKGAKPKGKLLVVENADHFWAGQTHEIKKAVSEFLHSLPAGA
jgi:hypothetical protein